MVGRDAMHMRCQWRSEDGTTLFMVLILLFLVAGLVGAMVTSAATDTMMSRNSVSQAQAQAAAEAGLNHSIDVVRTYLRDWESSFTNTNDAVSRILRGQDNAAGTADDGGLAWLPLGPPTPPARSGLGTLIGVSYVTRVHDDDDPALGNNWLPADVKRVCEGPVAIGLPVVPCDPTKLSGVPDAAIDHNGVFVVRATGLARDDTAVTVEAIMKPCPWPAIVTNGNLNMSGGPQILGDGGSVHANANIVEVGNAAVVQHNVTAVGTVTTNSNWSPVDGEAEGGQLKIEIPPVNVADYLNMPTIQASNFYRLGANGSIYKVIATATTSATVLVCTGNAACGGMGFTWSWQNSSKVSHMAGITATWSPGGTPNCATLLSNGIPDCGQGVYHAQNSDVEIPGNIGRVGTPSPYAMTMLVEGSVAITGTPHLIPAVAHPNVFLVTDGDLDMAGTVNCILTGQARVREQLNLQGNMTLTGQILVEDRWQKSTKVTGDSKVAGNATVFNDRLAVYDFTVAGWREFRR